jgi:hypothetical protein
LQLVEYKTPSTKDTSTLEVISLAWDLDAFQMVEQAEPLQYRTVGHARAEIPIAFTEECVCNIAALGLARLLLEYGLLLDADRLGRSLLLLQPQLGA